jgi:Tol biopolymer transport system component
METKADLKEAINLFETLIKNYPNEKDYVAKSLLYQGMCYERLGNLEAVEKYQQLVQKYPGQKNEVALAEKRLNYLDEQLASLKKQAEQHLKKGNELFGLWEYEQAIEEYKKAMEPDPNSLLALNAQYCIGQTWFRLGKYDLAMETFKKLVEENPESNITPVTELMISQVEHEMKNGARSENKSLSIDENTIVSEQGLTFRKYKTFVGKNDQITYVTGGFNMSPDCRFLVLENTVVPVDGRDAFQLVEMDANRAIYSPNMEKAAFYADSAIWVIPVSPETGKAIGNPKKLIEGNYKYQIGPSWSPDGKHLAFARINNEVYRDIWTISVDNGNLEPLLESLEEEGHPVWSPHGDKIVYKKGNDLWITSINEDDSKIIVENGGGSSYFSRNCKWLYHCDNFSNNLYSFSQKENFKLEIPKQIGRFASFSPDDKKMYFYKPSYDNKWGMKVVSASGGPSFTPSNETEVYGLEWTHDGQKILAQSVNGKGNIQYKIISLTSEKPLPIEINENLDGTPFPFGVSPDMNEIIFHIEHEEDRKDLYIIPFSVGKAKTTGPAKLIFKDWTGGAVNVTCSWSPDGEKIALIHKDDIWTVNLKNGEKRQITNTDENERWISWSPDGKLIKYFITKGHNRNLYIIPGNGGISKLIFKNVRTCTWSPDGKKAAIDTENEIKIISMETGEILENIISTEDLSVERIYSSVSYSPDGKNLAFICDFNENGWKTVLYKFSFKTKEITRLTNSNSTNGYQIALEWSPDSKWISYLTYEDVKVRPEGVLWEADFEEVKEKLLTQENN